MTAKERNKIIAEIHEKRLGQGEKNQSISDAALTEIAEILSSIDGGLLEIAEIIVTLDSGIVEMAELMASMEERIAILESKITE